MGRAVQARFEDGKTVEEVLRDRNTEQITQVAGLPPYSLAWEQKANGEWGPSGKFQNVQVVNLADTAIETIPDERFACLHKLREVRCPATLMRVGQSAFCDCVSLTSINLPFRLQTIGKGAFAGCTSLLSVDLPENLISLGYGAYADCATLKFVNLPPRLQLIGERCFAGCRSLESINFPYRLREIGADAFIEVRLSTLVLEVLPDRLQSFEGKVLFDRVLGIRRLVGKQFDGMEIEAANAAYGDSSEDYQTDVITAQATSDLRIEPQSSAELDRIARRSLGLIEAAPIASSSGDIRDFAISPASSGEFAVQEEEEPAIQTFGEGLATIVVDGTSTRTASETGSAVTSIQVGAGVEDARSGWVANIWKPALVGFGAGLALGLVLFYHH